MRITNEDAVKMVRANLQGYLDEYEQARSEFAAKAADDPLHYIEWQSEDLVQKADRAGHVQELLNAFEEQGGGIETLRQFLLDLREQVIDEQVQRGYINASTNPFDTAIEMARLKGRPAFIRQLRFLISQAENLCQAVAESEAGDER